MKTKKLHAKKTLKKNVEYKPLFKDSVDGYVHSDNLALPVELLEVITDADDHLIKSTFDFVHVGLLEPYVMNTSQAIRRLDQLVSTTLSEDGRPAVGSTGSPKGDYKKLLELIAHSAYAIGVLRGAKLEGASDARIARIRRFAQL